MSEVCPHLKVVRRLGVPIQNSGYALSISIVQILCTVYYWVAVRLGMGILFPLLYIFVVISNWVICGNSHRNPVGINGNENLPTATLL